MRLASLSPIIVLMLFYRTGSSTFGRTGPSAPLIQVVYQGGLFFTCTPLKFAKKKTPFSFHYFGYPVRTQLSVLTRVKILRSYLVLLLVCVAIFRVPTGAYGELRASPFFDSLGVRP